MSEQVARLPEPQRPLPESVRVKRGMQFSPNEMRTLRDKTGKTLTELLGTDLEDLDSAPDRIQSLVWIELRRQGYDVEWEDCGDVIPDLEEEPQDPTSAEASATSPPSASTAE